MADWPDHFVDLCYLQTVGAEWTWGAAAGERMDRIQRQPRARAHDAVLGLHIVLGNVGTMALLSHLAERLGEFERVLKPAGNLCLVADLASGHYAKVLLDAFFGARNHRDEIIWRHAGGESPASGYAMLYSQSARCACAGITQPVLAGTAERPASHSATSAALAGHLIAATTQPDDVVLDPLHGGRATATAARRLGRRSISIGPT